LLQASWDGDEDDAEGPAAKALRSLEQQVSKQPLCVLPAILQHCVVLAVTTLAW